MKRANKIMYVVIPLGLGLLAYHSLLDSLSDLSP
jgi:hypothetical protein